MAKRASAANPSAEAAQAVASLKKLSTKHDLDNLKRFGITAAKAFGVSMANIQKVAKPLGRSHALAEALWKTGWYEARMLSSLVDEPERVTPAQMDRWCRDFDNWGICDTVCFKLFDRTPHALAKVTKWSASKEEFVRRAATDGRNFVKKGVSRALRSRTVWSAWRSCQRGQSRATM